MKKIYKVIGLVIMGLSLAACSDNGLDKLKTTKDQAAELYDLAGTAAVGKKDAPITIVEVFSYDCRYCRKDYPMIMAYAKSHPNVRVIFKPFKAFGEKTQVLPQYAALAANQQGQFSAMHSALMTTNRTLNKSLVEHVAKELGLNVTKLNLAIESPAVQQQIERNTELMNDLEINGIPTVIVTQTKLANDSSLVGDVPQYVQTGFLSSDAVNQMVEQVEKDMGQKK